MRTRQNVYMLPAGDTTLHWYGEAVTAMKGLPRTNPLSWEYQAAVHGISMNPIPSPQRNYWAQCQHATSFFLPWHRMYLLHFERIVAEHILQLGGPVNWALPYWNYSKQLGWRVLPAAFRGATLPSGNANPLFVAQRKPVANSSNAALQAVDVDLNAALIAPPTTGVGGFFGSPAAGHFSNRFGELEATVHNRVHVAIGGLMSNPDFAALDPIFWLHHANIDRLWEVWLARDPLHQHLTTPYWLTGVPFDFHNATGAPVTMRTNDVLNLTAPALDYQYDDISDPLAVPPPSALVAGGVGALATPMKTPGPNDLAGATTAPVVLDDQVKHFQLPTPVTPQAFKQSGSPNALVAPGPASQLVQQVTLQLEHVTSTAEAPVYDIYLNVPDTDPPNAHQDRFVGRAAMFGIAQASDPAGQHAGSGQDFAFDITRLYHQLDGKNAIDPQNLRVSFVPVDPTAGAQVTVGRISLYFG